jgi:hypothetical protein
MGKEAIHQALEEMEKEHQGHHNAYCPHCRRANRVSRDELKRAAPDWQAQSLAEPADEKVEG